MMHTMTSSADVPTFEEYAAVAWPSLYRYAYLLAGNHADAEDIAQQTLMKRELSWSRDQGLGLADGLSPPDAHQHLLVATASQRAPA